jgi:hypothetical protein
MSRTANGQPPLFYKYKKEYLSEVTGYSLVYLCRVARGSVPLKQKFIDICCFKLGESEEALFGQRLSSPGGIKRPVTENPLQTRGVTWGC